MCNEIPGWPRQECLGTFYCVGLVILLVGSMGSMFVVNPLAWTWNLFSQIILVCYVVGVLVCIALWFICVFTPGYQCWMSLTRGVRWRFKCLCICEELDSEEPILGV